MDIGKIYDRIMQGCIAIGTLICAGGAWISAIYYYSLLYPPTKQAAKAVAKASGEAIMTQWWPPYLLAVCTLFLVTLWIQIAIRVFKKRNYAELKLHIFDYNSVPRELSSKNIWTWHFLRNKENGKTIRCELFLAFEKPGIKGVPKIEFVDMGASEYEIKEATDRCAIIIFSEEVKIGTLVITQQEKTQIANELEGLSNLRKIGVELRNKGINIWLKEQWESWEKATLAWHDKVHGALKKISVVDAGLFYTMDVVPPPRIPIERQFSEGEAKYDNRHSQRYNEHDYQVKRLEEIIRNLGMKKPS